MEFSGFLIEGHYMVLPSHVLKNVLGGPLKGRFFKKTSGFYSGQFGFCLPSSREVNEPCKEEIRVCVLVKKNLFSLFALYRDSLPDYFLILRRGDWCCLPSVIFEEAVKEGLSPEIDLDATHESALSIFSRESLLKMRYALWNDHPSKEKRS